MRALDGVIEALEQRDPPSSSWLVGEPCFPPPEVMRDALARASRCSFGYPPAAGLLPLREVLAARHSTSVSALTPDHLVVTSGAKGGLLAVLAALLEPGDELIHPLPCYPAYPAMATRFGARAVPVAEGNGDFESWPRAVAEHLGPRTKAVVLSSPSNPTGAVLTSAQAKALVDLCRDNGIRLICDEAYIDFRPRSNDDAVPADFDPERKTVIQVRSASKSWALCGWRIGWVVAEPQLAAQMAGRHAALLNPASGPAQEALVALAQVPDEYLEGARNAVSRRFNGLQSAIESTGLPARRPAGGFYVWLDVSKRSGDGRTGAFCVDLARRCGVGLWPGEDFGGSGHVRIAATAPSEDDWERSLASLVDALAL